MLAKILRSKYISYALDAIGVFSLASFLMLGLYLHFIVNLMPSCYVTDALIAYVQCGNDFAGEIIKGYFLLFSPLAFPFLTLLILGFVGVVVELDILRILTALTFLCIPMVSVFASFRLIYKIGNSLLLREKSSCKNDRVAAALLLLLIIIPSIFISGLKYQIIPPQSSHKAIRIDMWHTTLTFPRYYLESWSLIKIDRPQDNFQGTLGHPIHSQRKKNPFANLYVSYSNIDSSFKEHEKFKIRIVPQYEIDTDESLYKRRKEYFDKKVKEKFLKSTSNFMPCHAKDGCQKVQLPLYSSAEKTGDWEVYRASIDSRAYEKDIYVHRNDTGEIENLLECASEYSCGQKKGRKFYSYQRCVHQEDCSGCARECHDKSFGNKEFFVQYSFDKKYLDSYFDRHQKILNFIKAHTVTKNKVAKE